ncbi:MAG: C39 family peptidase [Planctomycetaceae bacterium]|nr:C39 family peptidase [Planctomycetales bacterium]MCB9927127.1 C39 family peptidase [Planctomycetaceae bacterium]
MSAAAQPTESRSGIENHLKASERLSQRGPFLGTLALVATHLCGIGWAVEADFESVLIKDIPHVLQKADFCGEACAEMFLKKLGHSIDQDFVFDQSGLDPLEGRGCFTRELATALRRVGFDVGDVWYSISADDSTRYLDAHFHNLHSDLKRGIPSILCTHYDEQPNTTEHFRLIVGYDAKTDNVIYHEPAIRDAAYRRMKRTLLYRLWPLKYDTSRWTLVRFRLSPGRLIDGTASTELTDADYAQQVMRVTRELAVLKQRQIKLKKDRDEEIAEELAKVEAAKAAGEEYEPRKLSPRIVSDFHVLLERPFLVIGDDSPAMVRQWSQGTIRWAVDRLKRQYFSQNPDHVINIWLFKDKASYQQNTVDIFGRRPHTPFGYYSPWDKALVMNIDTGGGTLVHEIVHPFIAANFPGCPSWFNEGLGSLYEQCNTNNGRIWGLTNWRLRGLQEAIKLEDYEMPTFEKLCGTSTREFYDEDPGTNYAQSRYLLYYLQNEGLLEKYYHEFRRSSKDDPTGYETLKRVLGEDDMKAFQEKWTEFVLGLRF